MGVRLSQQVTCRFALRQQISTCFRRNQFREVLKPNSRWWVNWIGRASSRLRRRSGFAAAKVRAGKILECADMSALSKR
jgi:hypothetical protein